jgi:hypothetical protein
MIKKIVLVFLLILGLTLVYLKFLSPKFSPKIENKINQVNIQVENIKETIAPEPTKMLANGLPNKYLIKTVFIQQAPDKNWSEPWQDACEEASLITVDYFYKNISSVTTEENHNAILKMIEFENTQNFTSDMNISQMTVVAQKYLNYQTKIINSPSVNDLKEYLVQNIPIIVPANGKILYQENKHFNDGGPYYHNIVILGYDDTKNQFIVHDVGTKAGAYFHYSYSLLMESIHDFPVSGNKEDINSGAKRVLVLLK